MKKNEKSHGHWSRAHELSVTWEIFFATNSLQEIELINNIHELPVILYVLFY